jgi:hypothetical protein
MESSRENAGLITFTHVLMVIAIVGLIVAYIVVKA